MRHLQRAVDIITCWDYTHRMDGETEAHVASMPCPRSLESRVCQYKGMEGTLNQSDGLACCAVLSSQT